MPQGFVEQLVQEERRLRADSQSSSASSCGDDSAFEHMEPLELDDIQCFQQYRFDSITEEDDPCGPIMDIPVTPLFSVAMAIRKQKMAGKGQNSNRGAEDEVKLARVKTNWKKALKAAQTRTDPWSIFHLDELPLEAGIRYRYNALKKTWKEEKVVVKIDMEAFGRGAMRECFRMKKLSNFSHNQDWTRDCNNYVAKRYMEEVDRETYFEDVKLQMDAKLWSEEYNRHHPPKPVDIFQMAVLEFPDREGRPLFHVEHFIEGDYIKYNSNSGFVEQSTPVVRQTPHAFSHFTFERSGHELIVVDVQGVGDLYTDPQIHTATGTDYGDGNLGYKGMSLFFHSHQCNEICRSLGLTKFDLSEAEKGEIKRQRLLSTPAGSASARHGSGSSETRIRGDEVRMCDSPMGDYFRSRSNSNSEGGKRHLRLRSQNSSDFFSQDSAIDSPPIYEDCVSKSYGASTAAANFDSVRSADVVVVPRQRRQRLSTDGSDDSGMELTFHDMIRKKSRVSHVSGQDDHRGCLDESSLGMVHWELARYHELCRFVDDGQYDKEAALFHLKCAAECGVLVAIVTMAKIYGGMPHDTLSEVELPPPEEEATKGGGGDEEAAAVAKECDKRKMKAFAFMEEAAYLGDRTSMVYVARALDTGINLGDPARRSARLALDWYEKICDQDLEDGGDVDGGFDDARYLLLARQAEIWLMESADGIKKDPNRSGDLYNEAAEAAMASMKGKLANKYYMLAEEAYGQVEEEEEEEEG